MKNSLINLAARYGCWISILTNQTLPYSSKHFEDRADQLLTPEDLQQKIICDATLTMSDLQKKLLHDMHLLEPLELQNKVSPIFYMNHVSLKNKSHNYSRMYMLK